MENKIDWSNLDLKNKSILELNNLRHDSYHRYFVGPNGHGVWVLLSTGSLGLFTFFLCIYLFTDYEIIMPMFLFIEFVLLGAAIGFYFVWQPAKKLSDQRWDEMEAIRKEIETELKTRDEKVKKYEELILQ